MIDPLVEMNPLQFLFFLKSGEPDIVVLNGTYHGESWDKNGLNPSERG